MSMPKAVLDSTVLISAFLIKDGPSRELLHQAQGGAFSMCLAEAILAEVRKVLSYPRIRTRYSFTDGLVDDYLNLLTLVAFG
jgi:putative PIN family toxin of toxin-antitoxin system